MKLPKKCRILPAQVPFHVPGFSRLRKDDDFTQAPDRTDCREWYDRFELRVLEAVESRKFLPVCRFSDGEYKLMFGDVTPLALSEPVAYLRHLIKKIPRFRSDAATVSCSTAMPGGTLLYSSGTYSGGEVAAARACYRKVLPLLAGRGVLAFHLSYGTKRFQERFFPALGAWLESAEVRLTLENHVPFYFVYGILRGLTRERLFKGRRVLVLHSAEGEARRRIEEGLFREGVAAVEWCAISRERSLFDKIDVTPFAGRVDFCVFGAGIGKPNIIAQLEPLSCPCIDAGYVFEVWKNDDMKWHRAFMVNDQDYDESKIRFR